MGNRPWPIASSSSPGRSTSARCAPRCSTRWTSSASAGSRSRRRRSGSSTTAADGETYHLHLIDTPGHVDFSYEVSRSLAACEGALLVVDAAQGVEAQTVANTYAAIEAGLELIPVLNKVDLPSAEPERVAAEIADLLGTDAGDAIHISAKTGQGVDEVLEAIVERIPPPQGEPDAPPRALIFDSEFDQYRGVVAYLRMIDGSFAKHEPIKAMQNGTLAEIDEIGFFRPAMTAVGRDGGGRRRLRDHRASRTSRSCASATP